jgi:hypothetical protein
MIDLIVNTMLHQLKGIEHGRHDVQQLLHDMWKSLWKQNDEINDSVYKLEEHANMMHSLDLVLNG